MASRPTLLPLFLLLSLLLSFAAIAQPQLMGEVEEEDSTDNLSAVTASSYPFVGGSWDETGEGNLLGEEEGTTEESARRALLWRIQYYISYAALSANRIPCPARSGRSYYTHNCYRARGRANPYHRGCSAITLCRR